MLRDIKSVTSDVLSAALSDWGEPEYRAGQILDWIYRRQAAEWHEMTNLPKTLRERLSREFGHRTLELVRWQGSYDTTQKFLWRLADGALIESVLIPANPALYSDPSDRHTICVSTQVGCAYGCRFCASGLDGWKRNLRVEEIVDQVLAVERWNTQEAGGKTQKEEGGGDRAEGRVRSAGTSESSTQLALQSAGPSEDNDKGQRAASQSSRLIDNLVIMGMGEPLANYENLLKALRILNASWGGAIGARKITVSTSGLVPQIRRLADEPEQFRLAISLHGATDTVRNRIMPINRKFPLSELMAACDYYQLRKGRMITFEYILMAGVNDHLDQAPPLARLAHRLHAKVNLIPYNTVGGLSWDRPTEKVQESFLVALQRKKVKATLRREKGRDIDAACGQLRLKTERSISEG